MADLCPNCNNSGTYCPLCWPSKLAGWESDAIVPTPVCPDFPAPTTDRAGKWVQPAYALPAMKRLVPIWSNWQTLELGSREPIDGDGGWVWTPADGDSEMFADLTVVAWFDLPACGDVAPPDPRDAEIAQLREGCKLLDAEASAAAKAASTRNRDVEALTAEIAALKATIAKVRGWAVANATNDGAMMSMAESGWLSLAGKEVLAILNGGDHG